MNRLGTSAVVGVITATVVAVVLGVAAFAVAAVLLWRAATTDDMGMMGDTRAGWHGSASHMAHSMPADEFDYLAQMVPHHEEAVAAARELRRSERAELRALGESIVRTQTAEIGQMRQWMAQWYPDRSTLVDYQPMMSDLSTLSGDRLDLTFLREMIGHHMAAVMASQHLLGSGLAEHHQVGQLARDISRAQLTEIRTMSAWLEAWD